MGDEPCFFSEIFVCLSVSFFKCVVFIVLTPAFVAWLGVWTWLGAHQVGGGGDGRVLCFILFFKNFWLGGSLVFV